MSDPVCPASALRDRVAVDYAWHTIPASAVEEPCSGCWQKATHKIGDQSGPENFHELTAYLCCGCLGAMGMNCRLYPPY